MTVYEDPFGYLRPFYIRLRENPSFARLAQQHQFDELVRVVANELLGQAALLRQYSHAAKSGLLAHLASVIEQGHSESIELWRATKDDRVFDVYRPAPADGCGCSGVSERRAAPLAIVPNGTRRAHAG